MKLYSCTTLFKRFALILGTSALLGSCAVVISLEPMIDSLEAQIRAKIADPVCSSDSQCRVITLDPKTFCSNKIHIAYSTQVSNTEELARLEERRRDYIYENAILFGGIPLCIAPSTPTPGARCIQSRCQLVYN